jgi:rhodanese-related sulfurtransferase
MCFTEKIDNVSLCTARMHTITREQLKQLVDAKATYVLIDVRERWECEQYGMIPTAHNIPMGEIPGALALGEHEFVAKHGFRLTRQDDLILYCRSGSRSQKVTEFALRQGFHAVNYKGSVLNWSEIDPKVKKY